MAAGLWLLCAIAAGVIVFARFSNGEHSKRAGTEPRVAAPAPAADEPTRRAPSVAIAPPAPAELPPAPPRPAEPPRRHEPRKHETLPDRVFTARCRTPGGGCVEQCAAIAGGLCVDPCFVHTEECSRDCLLPDGSCGWPPPE